MNNSIFGKRIIILFLRAMGLAAMVCMYAWAWYYIYFERVSYRLNFYPGGKGHLGTLAVYAVLAFFFMNTYGGLKIGYARGSDIVFSQLFAIICTNVVTYMQLCLMSMFMVRVMPMFILSGCQLLGCALFTFLGQRIYRRAYPPRNAILISGERPVGDVMEKFSSRGDSFCIKKCMNVSQGLDAIFEEIGGKGDRDSAYDGVIVWDISMQHRNEILKYCYGNSIRFYMMPKITDVIIKGAAPLHIFDTPVFEVRELSLTPEQLFVKRAVDVVCSLILLILSSPFMILTALAVKLYDGGPAIYAQTRVTEGSRPFRIYKFRSMGVDAEKDGVARLSSKGDSRITPVGRFIRKVRLDELPQLWNILKGDMSFIGPRPERPEIIAQYLEDMPEFAFRTRVKAGLAGYAQIYGKYNTLPYDKLKLDLFYIENYTIWLDFKLMLLTLKILFTPDSTEGVEKDRTTALK